MLLTLLIFVAGIFLLVKSSDETIKNAILLSSKTGVSQMAIGFILISVSTSLPELSVGVISALEGENLLSVGNVIGSNVSNLAWIFGLMALMFGFSIEKKDLVQIVQALNIAAIIALAIMSFGSLNILFGISCLIIFIFYSLSIMKEGYVIEKHKKHRDGKDIMKTFLLTLLCIAAVIISAKAVTDSAVEIANFFHIPESLIGATIVAFGTTMPELSVSIAALRRKQVAIVIGDSIGSIVTNSTLVLGVSALIHPITLGVISKVAALLFLVVAMLFFFISSNLSFTKKEGIVLLSSYILFLMALLYVQTLV